MLVGFTRCSRDQSFGVLGRNSRFMLVMATGSIAGTFVGGRLLGLVPSGVLLPTLAAIFISAVKVWRHSCGRIEGALTGPLPCPRQGRDPAK
jgi:uncharacterized membrane protein YfcA